MIELDRIMGGLRELDAQMVECMHQNRDPSDRADATYILTILERSEALLLHGDRLTAGTPDQQFFAEGLQQMYSAMRCIRRCMAHLDDLAIEAARSTKH